MKESEFLDKLNTLAQLSTCMLSQWNTPLPTLCKSQKTNPAYVVEGDYETDDMDYLVVENGGVFRPGCFTQCIGEVKDGVLTGECFQTLELSSKAEIS